MIDASKPMFNPAFDPLIDGRGTIGVLDARNVDRNQLDSVFHVTSPSPNSWTVPDAVSASFNFAQTYDYYLERHSRNSIDGSGGVIAAIVRVGNLDNAFYRPDLKAMFFGTVRPYAASLDVVSHELTHGVSAETAALIYQNQSGALNESFSDVFGEMVEARTTGQNDWLIGSQLQQPIRDMRNPGNYGHPSKMSEYQFLPNTEAGDNGGVHINSGIINHAYYLLAQGLPGAIGHHDAERIFYRCLTVHLEKQSQFLDARIGCIASAEDLFGEGSIQALRTAAAFDAVEIYGTPADPDPSRIPAVSAADSTLFLFLDSLIQDLSLGRREQALSDPQAGRRLTRFLKLARPAVIGDGSETVYVDTLNDLCGMPTDGSSAESCLGFQGLVHSVAASANERYAAFVLRDPFGNPDNRVNVLELAPGGTNQTFDLVVPVIDGGTIQNVAYADAMTFSHDGELLIYDALTQFRLANGTTNQAWSLYGIDLQTGTTKVIVPPIEGFDIGNPAFAHTSDHHLVFEGVSRETGNSAMVSMALNTGEFGLVGIVADGPVYPGFNGDDSAVVFTMPDAIAASGYSLYRQALLPDLLTTNGAPTLWLTDAYLGVIYRRGQFISTNSRPAVSITAPTSGYTATYPTTIQIQAVAADPGGAVARVEFYQGSQRLGEDSTGPFTFTWSNVVPGNYRLVARAIDNLGGATDSAPVDVTVNQSVVLRLTTPTKAGSGTFQFSLRTPDLPRN
jgi:hypothetical protein